MDITTHVENLPLKAKLLRVTVYKYIHYMSYTSTLAPHVLCLSCIDKASALHLVLLETWGLIYRSLLCQQSVTISKT